MTESFKKPNTITHILDESVDSLSNATNSIQSTLQLLLSVNKEFLRQTHVTKSETPYELVTEQEIANARHDVDSDLLNECLHFLKQSESGLRELVNTETNMINIVNTQSALLKNLKDTAQSSSLQNNSRINSFDIEKRQALQSKKERLLREIAMEDRKIAHESVDMNRLQAVHGIQELKQHESELTLEVTQLEDKLKLLEEQLQKAAESRNFQSTTIESMSKQVTRGMIADNLESIIHSKNTLKETGTTESLLQGEIEIEQYLQALHKVNMLIKVDPKALLSAIEEIKTLCTILFENHMSGKTAGRIIELLGLKEKVTIEEFVQEFPWTEDERHNFTNVMIKLIQENIITQNGTNFSLKQ